MVTVFLDYMYDYSYSISMGKDENINQAKKDTKWNKDHKVSGPVKHEPLFNINPQQFRFSIWFFIVTIIMLIMMNTYFQQAKLQEQAVSYSVFKQKIENGEIKKVRMTDKYYYGTTGVPVSDTDASPLVYETVPVNDPDFIRLLDKEGVEYSAVIQQEPVLMNLIVGWIIPFAFIYIIWKLMAKKMGGAGMGVMNFGRNKSMIVAETDTGVRFGDVAGAEESKEELMEVVDFLEHPGKYTEIGGKIPKGVLLVGPPGTGKTLLARAVAGEAKVPFFRMSGADFVEMFVGVGAARVRDLFRQAREKSPCIIFIDELDAIGKSRINIAGGNDEREQTLNQLLVEMDGFDSTTGVIILGATNRPEILDPALMRPGRFDRQVVMDRPDLEGREAILKIHSKNVKLADNVDLKAIARATVGFVGSDLANIINEAALLAVRAGRQEVLQEDLSEAIEKTVAGLQKKNRLINPRERKIVAYHETGHALTAVFTNGTDPVQKITIIPRGIGALGYTLQTPTEDRFLMSQDDILGKIDVLLGGRAAEQIIFNEISTGAANDLTRATDLVRSMITEYGMSEKFKNMVLSKRGNQFLGSAAAPPYMEREYSESTQKYIDEEIARILDVRYKRVIELLSGKRIQLESIANKLLEVETLEADEFYSMAGVNREA